MRPQITNFDIRYAELVLIGKPKAFDRERKDFIKNLDTIDLQAVPGSGKTTALLAKLLLLEKHLPFANGSGILVLSHTNTAVDEIKERIGPYCSKLFAYPNFVGTIQSFVDQLLAIPYYKNQFKQNIYRIDAEIYNEFVAKYRLPFGPNTWVQKNKSHDPIGYLQSIRFNRKFELIPGLGKTPAEFDLKDKNKPTYKALHKMKLDIMKWGCLHFDDAYTLAEIYLEELPSVKKLLQHRFKFVFVDEMQDMDAHQYELLDNIFHKKKVLGHSFQRIGDKNQAIFSGNVKLENIWKDREKKLKINGSHRLTQTVANIVQSFGLDPIMIEGRNQIEDVSPTVLVFNEKTIKNVIPTFASNIKVHKEAGRIPVTPMHPIKALGWTREHTTVGKLGIKDYFNGFSTAESKSKIDYSNLASYIQFYDKEKGTLEPIRKNLLNAFLRVLRLENIEIDERAYTKATLLRKLKDEHEVLYKSFNLNIYTWGIRIIKGQTKGIQQECADIFKDLLLVVFDRQKLQDQTTVFLDSVVEADAQIAEGIASVNNYVDDNVTVEIGTIHSAKGETHTATLYLETFVHNHESIKSKNQLQGNNVAIGDGVRTKEAAKMMYVGFSRPTHYLCFAVHQDRIDDEMRIQMQAIGWEIEIVHNG